MPFVEPQNFLTREPRSSSNNFWAIFKKRFKGEPKQKNLKEKDSNITFDRPSSSFSFPNHFNTRAPSKDYTNQSVLHFGHWPMEEIMNRYSSPLFEAHNLNTTYGFVLVSIKNKFQGAKHTKGSPQPSKDRWAKEGPHKGILVEFSSLHIVPKPIACSSPIELASFFAKEDCCPPITTPISKFYDWFLTYQLLDV